MGDGRWEMGDGKWKMGDGRWKMGDGRCKWEVFLFSFYYCFLYLVPSVCFILNKVVPRRR